MSGGGKKDTSQRFNQMSNNDRIDEEIQDAIDMVRVQFTGVQESYIDTQYMLDEYDDVRDERKEFEEVLKRFRTCLQSLAMECLDAKQKIMQVQTGGLMESDEFHQNIKPGHDDAFYGAQASNREMAREVMWPLELEDWESTRGVAEGPAGRPGTVSAEGTRKYTKRLSTGGTVHVVIDDRGREP